MTEALAFVVFSFIATVFIINNIVLRSKLLQKKIENAKLEIDKTHLKEEILVDKVTDMDGFVKFLTESRTSAFEYIEEVQKAIQDLHLAMESDDENAIKGAYLNLMKFLPEETTND